MMATLALSSSRLDRIDHLALCSESASDLDSDGPQCQPGKPLARASTVTVTGKRHGDLSRGLAAAAADLIEPTSSSQQ